MAQNNKILKFYRILDTKVDKYVSDIVDSSPYNYTRTTPKTFTLAYNNRLKSTILDDKDLPLALLKLMLAAVGGMSYEKGRYSIDNKKTKLPEIDLKIFETLKFEVVSIEDQTLDFKTIKQHLIKEFVSKSVLFSRNDYLRPVLKDKILKDSFKNLDLYVELSALNSNMDSVILLKSIGIKYKLIRDSAQYKSRNQAVLISKKDLNLLKLSLEPDWNITEIPHELDYVAKIKKTLARFEKDVDKVFANIASTSMRVITAPPVQVIATTPTAIVPSVIQKIGPTVIQKIGNK